MLHFISSMAAIRDSEMLKWAFSCKSKRIQGYALDKLGRLGKILFPTYAREELITHA